jgi:hypothetical protein
VVECDDETSGFGSQWTLSLSMHPDTTDNELEEIAKVIQATYNDLNEEDLCDPLMRRIEEMAVSAFIGFDESSSTGGCANVEVVFDVLGECRGCGDDTSLVDEGGGKKNEKIHHRDLEQFSAVLPTRRRGLKNTDFCFCNKKTRANRAPTLGELEEALEKTFEKLNSDLFCGLAKEDIDPPESKSPTILPSTMSSASPTRPPVSGTCTGEILASWKRFELCE